MNLRNKNGSITIFVLVGLLFMSAFLVVSYANNVNKSKIAKEQFNIMSDIYSKGNDEQSYTDAYTDLRNKNKQLMTASSEGNDNKAILELTKTYGEKINNYRIYGNSIQNAVPTETTPVLVESAGTKYENIFNFDMIKGQVSLSKGTVNYDDKSLFFGASTGADLCIIGQSYTGVPNAFEKFNQVLNITESGYYCLKAKITSEEADITPRAEWRFNVTGSGAMAPKLIETKQKDGYIFVKYEVTEEILESLKTKAETFRLYLYKFRKKGTSDPNLETTISEIVFVKGDYTIDSLPKYENYGKNGMQIKLSNESGESKTTDIYLDEPLRKIGSKADYIDFKTGKVIRNIGVIDSYNGETISTEWMSTTGSLSVGATVYYVMDKQVEENISLPELSTFEDYTKIEVITDVKPSKIELEYTGYTI